MKWVAALSAVALVSGVLSISANAQIGASGSPLDTVAPDLRSVTLDGDEVSVCFDEQVTDAGGGGAYLQGYNDEMIWDITSLDEDEDNDDCLIGDVDDDINPEEATIGVVEEGVAEDRQSNENTQNSAELAGSEAEGGEGLTTGPDLIEVDINEGQDEIEYVFDEDCMGATLGGFGYYTEDGDKVYAAVPDAFDPLSGCDDDTVTIAYDEDLSDADATEGFVDQGTVTDLGDTGGDTDANPLGTEEDGDQTDDLELESAERDGEDVEYCFDGEIDTDEDDIDETLFQIYEEDGDLMAGSAGTADMISDECVEITFNVDGLEDMEDFEVPLAAVQSEAVEGAVNGTENADESDAGDAPLAESNEAAGFTDGPDLLGVDANEAADEMTFRFDEPVDEDETTSAEFHTVELDGDIGDNGEDAEVEGNEVTVEFGNGEIDDSVGGSVDDQATADFSEFNGGGDPNWSPIASAGTDADASPTTGGTTTTTTTTTSTSTSTTPAPEKRKVATNVTKPSYENNRFRGSVINSVKRCQDRTVKLKKHVPGKNRNVHSTTSSRNGNYKMFKRNARGRFYVVAPKKKFTNNRGVVIVCRWDKSPTTVVR